MIRRPPRSTLLPSPTLFRSRGPVPGPALGSRGVGRRGSFHDEEDGVLVQTLSRMPRPMMQTVQIEPMKTVSRLRFFSTTEEPEDRKSTRLNSSHANISYAVF